MVGSSSVARVTATSTANVSTSADSLGEASSTGTKVTATELSKKIGKSMHVY